jgi:membrane associated rhomboid family serine protease
MALNVLIYFLTLPGLATQERELLNVRVKLGALISQNPQLLSDEQVRRSLKEEGLISDEDEENIKSQIKNGGDQYAAWLGGTTTPELRDEFNQLIRNHKVARENHLYFKWGFAPNGDWKIYQLITCAFLHGGLVHLFGNLIFFFAVGFSLEDLWGRGVFTGFYLLGAIAACIPTIISPIPMPSIGASGAISATMGAFLVRLYRTKILIRWFTLPLAIPFMMAGKKPWGKIMLAAYLYIPFWVVYQILEVWYYTRVGIPYTTGFSAHFAGFAFGVLFALFMKASKVEENYIHPKIEAKVSFSAAPAITQALDILDKGGVAEAERILKAQLMKSPNDVDTILALIQVYQRSSNFDQLNQMYGRLIHHHLSKQDRDAALIAYDNLLSAFPDNHVDPRIPVRDWMGVCEYLTELNMNREASVEYERLVKAHSDDASIVRACIQGGEAAFLANEVKRALALFEKAKSFNPPAGFSSRIESGLEKCRKRLDNLPRWAKEPNRRGQQKASF